MKKILFIIILLASFLPVNADDNRILMEEAVKDYNEGRYEQAIELYRKVIVNGYESADLYYNMGNAYFKTNSMAPAILYYEKALKLDPTNEDAQFNLQIANSRIIDKIESVPEIFYVKWWKSLTHALSADNWGWVSIGAFTLFLLMLLGFLLSRVLWVKKLSFWLGIFLLVITVSSYSLANNRYKSFRKDHEAIVFTPTVTVKSSPSENSIDLFVIHEGTKVQITDHVGNWYEVKIANGSQGWLPEDDIRKI
ncbi:MAG: tetratricopeptide repeat protein [Bacteroidales bacterium]